MYMSLLLMGKPQALLLLLGQQNHNQLHKKLGQQLLDLIYSTTGPVAAPVSLTAARAASLTA